MTELLEILDSLADFVRDNAIHRAVVKALEWIGADAIVDFDDLDRPGRSRRVVVAPRADLAGLAIGDECLIRFRVGLNIANPAHWELVERCVQVPMEQSTEGKK